MNSLEVILDIWSQWRGTIRGTIGLDPHPKSVLGIMIRNWEKDNALWEPPADMVEYDEELMSMVDYAVCRLPRHQHQAIRAKFTWGRHLTVDQRIKRLKTSRRGYYRDIQDAYQNLATDLGISID